MATQNENNFRRFEFDMRQLRDKILPELIGKVTKAVSILALRRVVLRTPVDTGRARGNWHITLGSASGAEFNRFDQGGSETIGGGVEVISRQDGFQSIFINNNLPYIGVLEDGSSVQAPQGMVAVTLRELEGIKVVPDGEL